VVPLRELGDGLWLAELFHGPTLAFKDLALQLVGRLFDHELDRRSERATIVVATSGDTGSAAIEACRGRDALDIFVLHPSGRVSEVQRRQMTTVLDPNVHNVAVEGTFDDCQELVKGLFADDAFRDRHHLSAMNSINWARVMAQIVYYVWATARLGRGGPVSFTVPTGNFGNIFAGYVAMRMGTPVRRLQLATNRNDILTRFFEGGSLEVADVVATHSPSMDIQVSSNLERLLFEAYGRRGDEVAELQMRFRADGRVPVDADRLAALGEVFTACRVDEDETLETIRTVFGEHGVLLDPHTAVGVRAAQRLGTDAGIPMVCLATAHPAKFPDAVERATGTRPPVPPRLAGLDELPERFELISADLDVLRALVDDQAR
jgi:threonine synthase